MTEFKFYKSHEWSRNPLKAHPNDSGYDVCSCQYETINSKQWKTVSTGLHFDIPEGWEIQVFSRSGLASKTGIFVLNSPGLLDEAYTGELKVILANLGEFPFHISPGDRIAQIVLKKRYETEMTEIDHMPNKEGRGSAGFGSSGIASK